MTESAQWPEVDAAIESTRQARDSAAQGALRARSLGIPTLGDQLDDLAASHDRLLAVLLRMQKALPKMSPAP